MTQNIHWPVTRSLAIIGVLLMTVLAFWPALSGGFIFDDYPIFAENPAIHVTGWHGAEWHRVWMWSLINIQRPLAMLSYALNYAFGSSTWGFKVTNLGIHVLNTWLVWQLARRVLRVAWQQPQTNTPRSITLDYWALGISAAWAIHPLQVSSVMYVVQRMELLGFSFVLLALLAYWRARQRQRAGQRGWPWLLLAALLMGIGYGAKETAVLVPGYALLLELCLLHFAASRASIRIAWKLFYAAGCLAAVMVFFGYLLPHYANVTAYTGRSYDAWQRELTQLRALPMYLGWIVLPLPSRLGFYYDNYAASTGWLHPATTLYGGLFLLGLLALAVSLRKRRPLFALGIGWFFVAHLLTSSPIPLELVFEHRNYPALFGIVLAVTDLLWLVTQRASPRLPLILAGIVIANFGFLTFLRASTWSSPLQLATTLAAINPGSPRAAQDLARRYVAMSGNNPDNPLYSLGIQQLEHAASLPASSILPEEALLIQAASHPGAPVQPIWASVQAKLRQRPMGPETYEALNGLFQQRIAGNTGIDAEQLGAAYAIAIARNPDRQGLHVQYAELAGSVLRDPTLAIEHWQQALRLESDMPVYARQLAGYLVESHREQEALAVIAKADQLQPELQTDPTLQALRAKATQALLK